MEITQQMRVALSFVMNDVITGFVVFMFDLGSGPASLISTAAITINSSINTITFGHNGTNGYLSVEGQSDVYGTSQGLLSMLNSRSAFYVGGTDLESDVIPRDVYFRGQFLGENNEDFIVVIVFYNLDCLIMHVLYNQLRTL